MESFTTEQGVSPTLSTGIVLVHHLMPLSDALDKARQTEKSAKSVAGKHALAITASKRSGADRTIRGPRKELEGRLAVMIDWRRDDAISAGTPYELYELHRLLAESNVPPEALMEEALRIIDRKREAGGGEMSNEQKKDIREKFKTWFKDENISLEEIAYEMIIAGQFASAQNLAGVSEAKQGGHS
jgi:CRISPR-associated protein Cmr2